jgi:hypothetical protein
LKKDGKIYYQQSLLQNNYKVNLIQPGEYEIVILFDTNNNGKWNTGNYWKKIQPERVVARKETFNIRSSWDNELTVDMSAIK